MKYLLIVFFLFPLSIQSQSKGFIVKDIDSISVSFRVRNLVNTFDTKNYKLESKVKYKEGGKVKTIRPSDNFLNGFCIEGKTQKNKNKLICFEHKVFGNIVYKRNHVFARRLTILPNGDKVFIFMYPPANDLLGGVPEKYLLIENDNSYNIITASHKNKFSILEAISKKCDYFKVLLNQNFKNKKNFSNDRFIQLLDDYNEKCTS